MFELYFLAVDQHLPNTEHCSEDTTNITNLSGVNKYLHLSDGKASISAPMFLNP